MADKRRWVKESIGVGRGGGGGGGSGEMLRLWLTFTEVIRIATLFVETDWLTLNIGRKKMVVHQFSRSLRLWISSNWPSTRNGNTCTSISPSHSLSLLALHEQNKRFSQQLLSSMVTAKNLRFTTAMKERESERKRLIEGGRREQLLELRQLFAVSAVWKCTWLNILFFFYCRKGEGIGWWWWQCLCWQTSLK